MSDLFLIGLLLGLMLGIAFDRWCIPPIEHWVWFHAPGKVVAIFIDGRRPRGR